jgi:hypothetical protein
LFLSAAPKRPVQIITPTYPPANATFNSSMSTLAGVHMYMYVCGKFVAVIADLKDLVAVMKKEIENAHSLMQTISKPGVLHVCLSVCVCVGEV